MRRAFSFAVLALAALTGWYAFARAQDTRGGGPRAERTWEYRVRAFDGMVTDLQDTAKAVASVESKFNELGRDGWEYCGTIPGAAVFKRSRP